METTAKIYLKACSIGFCDGSRKADAHQMLLGEYLNTRFLAGNDWTDRIAMQVLRSEMRKATLPLTDYLDEVIGFPVDKVPNYKKLVPLFVSKFTELLDDFFDENPKYMNEMETTKLMEEATKFKLSKVFRILEAYGFHTIDGSPLVMRSALGLTVIIRPNEYIGCNWEYTEDYI